MGLTDEPTRVPDLGLGADFDHGAQYFTVRSPELSSRVQQWSTEGVVAPWQARIVALGPDGLDAFADPVPVHFDAAFVNRGPLRR